MSGDRGHRTHSTAEPEDLVSITKAESAGDQDGATLASAGPTRELELRLREQTAQNAELDREVRYLQAELAVTKELARVLEQELESAHLQAGQQVEVVAEFQLYRERFSHRLADRLAEGIHRRRWLYRPLKLVGRAVAALASRPDRPTMP